MLIKQLVLWFIGLSAGGIIAASPIFSLDNTGLQRNGLVGGYFFDEKTVGRKVVEITNGVLSLSLIHIFITRVERM